MAINNEDDDDGKYKKELDRMARLMEKQQLPQSSAAVTRDKDATETDDQTISIFRASYSLEILTVVVSLVFVATVALFGEKFVVSVRKDPSSPSSSIRQSTTKWIDADSLLREEFQKVPSSVEFQ
jgi:hypothetical protein